MAGTYYHQGSDTVLPDTSPKEMTPVIDCEQPLTLSEELARDKRAMQSYARLAPVDKCRVLARAGRIRSRESLRLLALSLCDEVRADEYF